LKNKILIVGGTGFLGQNLIKKLNRKKYEITSLSSNPTPKINKFKNVKYIILDIKYKKNFSKLQKKKFNFIINLGGNINHKDVIQTNNSHYVGCKNILNEINLKTLNLFIQIGSSLEYGNIKSPQIETRACKPNSIYGKAKLNASKYIISKSKKEKINYLILRLYQVYGPYQKTDRLISSTIKHCLQDREFKCTDGRQLRDFLYVSDFVDLIIKILEYKKAAISGIYNVGCGKPLSVKYVIKTINKIIQKGKPLYGKIKMRNDETKSLYPSNKKINKKYKWTPKINFLEGIKKTIKYYE